MMKGHEWTEQQDELLTRLWLDGWSAKKIVDKFPERTRNSIIGRVHRLGLQRIIPGQEPKPRPEPKPKPKPKKKEHRVSIPPRPPAPQARPEPEELQPILVLPDEAQVVSILELKDRHCRSVVSEHGGPGGLALYCGRRVARGGASFCPQHEAIYYRPAYRR